MEKKFIVPLEPDERQQHEALIKADWQRHSSGSQDTQ